MNVSCPECQSVFRVDPAKIPSSGVRARCSVCGGVITVGVGNPIDEEFAPPPRNTPAAGRSVRSAPAMTPTYAPPSVPFHAMQTATVTPPPVKAPRVVPPSVVAPPSAAAAAPIQSAPVEVAAPVQVAPSPSPVPPPAPVAPAAAAPVALPPRPTVPSRPVTPPTARPAVFPPRPSTSAPAGSPQTGAATPPRSSASPRPPAPPPPIARPSVAVPPVRPTPPAARVAPPARPSIPVAPIAAPPAAAPSGGAASPSVANPATITPSRAPINPFLSNDPSAKARRLARALISDLVTYFPQRREEGLRDGTLRDLFKEEIKKSYEEYVEQVGREFADSTTHFQEALNEILASGQKVF